MIRRLFASVLVSAALLSAIVAPLPLQYQSELVEVLCNTDYVGECVDLDGDGVIRGDFEMGA